MKNVEHSQTFLRKRKMLMVLPFLVIPFLTMAFWAMGGGKKNDQNKLSAVQGLNLNLPDPKQKEDKLLDKLSFYDKADKDSAKMAEWMRSDPYYKEKADPEEPVGNELEQLTQTTASKYNQKLNVSPFDKGKMQPEDQVMQKLSLLQKELNKNSVTPQSKEPDIYDTNQPNPEFASEVDRLENMMGMMNKGNTEDPEIKQINNTLQKILDVQHPEIVRERIKEKSLLHKETVFAVSKQPSEKSISLLDTSKKKSVGETGFFGLEEEANMKDQNAIEAVIHENQTLVNGAVVKLRLLNDVYIAGALIPKDGFVFGLVSLNGERLEIEINSIRSGNSLFPVKLEVFDMDGLPGIYIPGAITRDVAKQSADNSLQLMELSTMDPSLKAQAAAAGINTAKNLLSKKTKLVKVMVKAGYKVLLKDKKAE